NSENVGNIAHGEDARTTLAFRPRSQTEAFDRAGQSSPAGRCYALCRQRTTLCEQDRLASAVPVRLLVLGGTAWLGRFIATTPVERGHHVTCLAPGASGAPPPGGAFPRADRAGPAAHRAGARPA